MKVGIMTMHRIPNYGSFMQAFALKKLIESLGHEVIFVDYKIKPDVENRDSLKSQIICLLKNYLKKIYGTKIGNNIYFFIKYHSKSKNVVKKQQIFFSCNDMLGVTNQYHFQTKVDVLVIGSDEVFNCTQLGYNVGYSLELFGKYNKANRVITYAASFGNTTLKKLSFYGITEEIGNLLKKIDAISVRDKNSYTIVKKIAGIKSIYHFDPVLIGDLEDECTYSPTQEKYVIVYGYAYRFTKHECDKILEYAHSFNKKVIAIGEPQLKYDLYICCKPNEVLGYFRNADYVITDTFHGTIFSVITHKKFLTVIRTSNTGVNGNEEKLKSLLADLELEERELLDFNYLGKITDNIDYKKIDLIRKKARNEAIGYLKANIR